MSAATRDDLYLGLLDAADRLRPGVSRRTERLRRDFAEHLRLVAAALREIERVDRGEALPGDEADALRAVFVSASGVGAARRMRQTAKTILEELQGWIGFVLTEVNRADS